MAVDRSTAEALALWAYDKTDGKATIKAAIDEAALSLLAGDSGVETSVTVAGKTFTYSGGLTVQDRLATFRLAYNNLCIALGEEPDNQVDTANRVTFQLDH